MKYVGMLVASVVGGAAAGTLYLAFLGMRYKDKYGFKS